VSVAPTGPIPHAMIGLVGKIRVIRCHGMEGDMLDELKSALRVLAPRLYIAAGLVRRWRRPAERINRAVGKLSKWTVAGGPFAGMKYVRAACGSSLSPKLIGSCELEIQTWIRDLLRRRFSAIIDVGSAEGYYAVGFARLEPTAQVVAFDTDPVARHLCRRMSEQNGVGSRVSVRSKCTPEVLCEMDLRGTLLVVDCETYELELLDPKKVPGLSQATILVEMHDCYVPGLTDVVTQRFAETHSMKWTQAESRDPAEFTILGGLDPVLREAAVDEGRLFEADGAPQRWGLFVPRESNFFSVTSRWMV